jgi:c-di-GMP-related signal transduction protein
MDVFVARQPIFDSEMNVFAYELLFRSSLENFYDTRNDSNLSTLSVITSSLLVFGLDTLTSGKPAFINFTKKLLLRGTQASLPKELFAIEVIEGIEPDMLVLRACRELKDKGYLIVLDDFVLHDYKRTLLDIADIIKVDFLNTTPDERAHIVQACNGRNIALLAEKIETPAHMQEALDMGYSYFQGYYLAKPTVLHSRDIAGSRLNFMRALKQINQSEFDLAEIEEIIKHDIALTYKLIRFTNSAHARGRVKVQSIRHALSLLGPDEIRKWAGLLSLCGPGDSTSDACQSTALMRARFCENIAGLSGHTGHESDFFLMGLFSVLDMLIGRPMESVLEDLHVHDSIRSALLGHAGPYRDVFDLALAFENADPEQTCSCAQKLCMDEGTLSELFSHTVHWVNQAC